MNYQFLWRKKLKNGFLHEKAVFCSLFFLLVILSFDCFFQKLPITGYCLVIITLLLIGLTTCATCHGIKWAITSYKPFQICIFKKSQSDRWMNLLKKYEDKLFKKLFHTDNNCLESFKYPTSLNEQIRLLLKDIERDFVKTWYSDISQNPSFLFDSHLILEEIFFKIITKLKTLNCRQLIKSLLQLYLSHLQEYKRSNKKMVRLVMNDETKPKMELPDYWRFSHPGSQSDHVLNYYFKKVTKAILKEFSPHDFSNSLECKILGGIIGRKVIRKFLMTVEDPIWISIKLIYLIDARKYEELLQGKIYVVKEKILAREESEFQYKKPNLLGKKYLSTNLFENKKNLFEKNEENDMKVNETGKNIHKKVAERKSLTLPLYSHKVEAKGNISTVLSGLIPSTAGPLLPDNISVHYQALNKMWQSPMTEVKEISESITNSLRRVFTDGGRDKKILTRSKSTESLGVPAEFNFKVRDVSIGEELCENINFGKPETPNQPLKIIKKLTKTHSFDDESLIVENDADDVVVTSPVKKSPELQKDVSPVYEEPEDFATTIAKLRSLLQQRESSSTLSDNSNMSVDSQSADKCYDSNKSQSLEGDSFDSQTTNDIPTDGRLFINLSIPKSELITEAGSAHVVYSIIYDGVYVTKQEQYSSSEPELVLQTAVVKRKFQDFLQLQVKLEENSFYKASIKGVRGPAQWLSSTHGCKSEDSSTHSRRLMLESFLRFICSKTEISNSPEVLDFLEYGLNGNDACVKKGSEPSMQRIDKLLANKVTGVFNSIKTVLPSFDFESTALIATNDTVKGFQEQKLLQGFLNFGNKSELFELNLNFIPKEQNNESLSDDIRHYFSQKSDCIENAVDVLDSDDWLAEQKECRFISTEETCVWQNYKEFLTDDELEPLDASVPIFCLLLDIISELFEDSDSWLIKEPVIRLIKVAFGHWEAKLEEELSKLDWDRISANIVRLLRTIFFHSPARESADICQEDIGTALKDLILATIPGWITGFVKEDGLTSAVSIFVDSFQYFRINRDILLRLMDILLVHLLSCHHLTELRPK